MKQQNDASDRAYLDRILARRGYLVFAVGASVAIALHSTSISSFLQSAAAATIASYFIHLALREATRFWLTLLPSIDKEKAVRLASISWGSVFAGLGLIAVGFSAALISPSSSNNVQSAAKDSGGFAHDRSATQHNATPIPGLDLTPTSTPEPNAVSTPSYSVEEKRDITRNLNRMVYFSAAGITSLNVDQTDQGAFLDVVVDADTYGTLSKQDKDLLMQALKATYEHAYRQYHQHVDTDLIITIKDLAGNELDEGYVP